MLSNIRRFARDLNDHWIGDLIGAVCLFAAGYGLLLLGYAVGLE